MAAEAFRLGDAHDVLRDARQPGPAEPHAAVAPLEIAEQAKSYHDGRKWTIRSRDQLRLGRRIACKKRRTVARASTGL